MPARMVKLNRIYTRTGDDGTTGLGGGGRVPKTDPRVEAYGTVDEANAAVGVAIAACRASEPGGVSAQIAALLTRLQNDLFDVGADLCVPMASGEAAGARLRVTPGQTAALEAAIDRFNARLAPLNSFVLPGGTDLAAALHVARTVVRRAERRTVGLQQAEPDATNPEAVRYLNRLSDLLFVLARVANDDGKQDVLWSPGAGR
ncbi:MAG TPA: cob(I)yrinic acid a,c-diamide adenosyltransferase [Phycisphaerales bacterium]|nr:cob(I)yrinic acid a,c-diamide adenosyltransferase [Phycisphaerales bacterium]